LEPRLLTVITGAKGELDEEDYVASSPPPSLEKWWEWMFRIEQ
jgi:hypothetical protein